MTVSLSLRNFSPPCGGDVPFCAEVMSPLCGGDVPCWLFLRITINYQKPRVYAAFWQFSLVGKSLRKQVYKYIVNKNLNKNIVPILG